MKNVVSGFFENRENEIVGENIVVNNNEESIAQKEDNEKFKILVVEDNATNRKLVKNILIKSGFSCDFAENGKEAKELVIKNAYNIVFMDCQMPELDGYESTRLIRELEGEKKHTIIVAMTANVMTEDRKKCIDVGMDEFLGKPISAKEVIDMIKKYQRKETFGEDNLNQGLEEKTDIKIEWEELDMSIKYLMTVGFDEKEAKELLEEMIENDLIEIKNIRENLLNERIEEVRSELHTIIGSAGNLKIDKIATYSIEIREAVINNKKEKALMILEEQKEYCEKLLSKLKIEA